MLTLLPSIPQTHILLNPIRPPFAISTCHYCMYSINSFQLFWDGRFLGGKNFSRSQSVNLSLCTDVHVFSISCFSFWFSYTILHLFLDPPFSKSTCFLSHTYFAVCLMDFVLALYHLTNNLHSSVVIHTSAQLPVTPVY